ncbi:isochorismatase family cysteine hydrolase [Nocardia sp. CY41]|uniref:isochorismatase family cysteine hydrolase n=1 Tax=Nocardia sp. CY41 TaxID=2608686 RepID=UPI0019156EFE|nr:isochorismatase family cysteine hydrolase [Nocardia sp. CY41]
MTIRLEKAALLVVDAQKGFVNQHSAPAIPVVLDLATQWAATGRPTVFTRYWNYAGSPYETLIGWRALYGPPDTDLVDELVPLMTHVNAHTLDKTTYTALTDEGLALLGQLDVTDLIICGIATDACVLKTALDAFERGYIPWVVRDAVASNATRHPAQEIHDSALLHISRLIGAGQLIDANHVRDVIETAPAT